jgi:hypothetical protein
MLAACILSNLEDLGTARAKALNKLKLEGVYERFWPDKRDFWKFTFYSRNQNALPFKFRNWLHGPLRLRNMAPRLPLTGAVQ